MDCPAVIGAARGYITGVVTSAATDFESTKYPLSEVCNYQPYHRSTLFLVAVGLSHPQACLERSAFSFPFLQLKTSAEIWKKWRMKAGPSQRHLTFRSWPHVRLKARYQALCPLRNLV